MKKLVLVLVTLSLSQLGFSQKVRWGAKAGYNLATLDGDYSGIDYISGYHVGGLAEVKVSLKFSLQTELLYSLEGGKYAFELNEAPFAVKASEKVKLGYLNLPVMVKYFVVDGFTFEAGPQIGYLLSGKSDYASSVTINGETIKESGTIDVKDNLKTLSYGFNVGIGYELKNNLFFQARYHLGLSNNSKANNTTEGEDDFIGSDPEKLKNQSFQFSIGYKF